jgi:uncharacterized SAM-binding protein YcdF (DUF218 family)
VGSTRKPALRRAIRLAFAATIVIGAIALLRTAGSTLVVQATVDNPDAIVSLASHEWERLPVAAEIARDHPGARVFLTQPPVVSRYNCHDCANRARYLASLGVDPQRIVVVPMHESSTYGEAIAIARAIRPAGCRRLLIVTSPYHTRRALAVFRKVLREDHVAVGVVPALAFSGAAPGRWWSSPYDRWYVTYEWCAMVTYLVRGRL